MMKYQYYHIILIFFGMIAIGNAQQELARVTGLVSYKSSRNVYAKFQSTQEITVGDTLFLQHENKWQKALIVQKKSTTSCITESLADWPVSLGDSVSYLTYRLKQVTKKEEVNEQTFIPQFTPVPVTQDSTFADTNTTVLPLKKQSWNGRITLSTNASITSGSDVNYQRLRFAASMKALNIHNSPWSAEIYSTYRHRYGIEQANASIFNDIRLFTLAVSYNPGQKYNFTFGRKINNQIANMGPVDGIQSEFPTRWMNIGLFAGSRPDFRNFGLNTNLPQFGLYISKLIKKGQGTAQTSLAFAEQQYNFKTDRRFLYLQHNNNLFPAVSLFLSSELDLYQKIGVLSTHSASLTSVYANVRYRIRKNLSLSASYDQRRNIIYYESYQTFIDQLLAQETRQGWRFQGNYTPFRGVTLNASTFIRYQGTDSPPTKNYIFSMFINSLPVISGNLQLSANVLETSYFNGTIYSARLSKNLFKGKCNIEMQYRHVDYTFFNSESTLLQHIGGINIYFNIFKKTSLSCSYEGTFEDTKTYHRYFVTLTQRIKH